MKKRCCLVAVLIGVYIFSLGAAAVFAESDADLAYTYCANGIEITDCNEDAVNVIIPETIEGRNVVSINSSAFSGCNNLKSIVIPSGVNYIDNNLFLSCPNITRIEYYGNYLYACTAFKKCTKLETLIYPNVGEVENSEFEGFTSLKKFAGSPKKIGDYAFSGCTALEKFYFSRASEEVTVGNYAFANCTALSEISLSRDEAFGEYVFSGCTSLKSIFICKSDRNAGFAGNNSERIFINAYASAFTGVKATVYYPKGIKDSNVVKNDRDGALSWVGADFGSCGLDARWEYDESSQTLTIRGTGDIARLWSGSYMPWAYVRKSTKRIVFESGIERIPAYTFEYMESPEEIILPDTLKSLAYNAFNGCTSLKKLIIPASLEEFVSEYGFISCTSLADIGYEGTSEQFEKVVNSSYAERTDNSTLYPEGFTRTIHFLKWNKPKAATCGEEGYLGYYSFGRDYDCDYVYNEDRSRISEPIKVMPTGQHKITLREGKSASCFETGEETHYECTVCKKLFKDKEATAETSAAEIVIPINPKNHAGGTELRNAAEVSAETDGYTGDTYCLGCNSVIEKGENIYKIKICCEKTVSVGKSIKAEVRFATNRAAQYLDCVIKYPNGMRLKSVIAKDFKYVSAESAQESGGFITTEILCQYSDSGSVALNTEITPFELVFDVLEDAAVGNTEIQILNGAELLGDDEYPFEHIFGCQTTVLPAKVESIEIIGADRIAEAQKYTANILPAYAANKEVVWSVNDESIATVSSEGVLTPLKRGTVILTAAAKDGGGALATKTVSVIEYAKIDSLTMNVGVISPEFSPNVREYTVYVPKNTSEILIKAQFSNGGVLYMNDLLMINGREKKAQLMEDETKIELKRSGETDAQDSTYVLNIVRFEGTKTGVSADKKEFNIVPVNISAGKTVILTLYGAKGLLDMKAAEYSGQNIKFETNVEFDFAKVMVWESLKDISPVCGVENVGLTN